MGRLKPATLESIEVYSDRVMDVARALERKRVWRRVVDQLVGSGGSLGANAYEADQALSRKDFVKCLGTVLKEINESKYWMRKAVRRKWLTAHQLGPLLRDTDEWLAIFNRMIVRTRANDLALRKRKRRAA